MDIRPYEAADETGVIDLWQHCDLLRPANDPRADIARKLRVNPEWFLVGVWDAAIIATVMAGYEGHRGWINHLAVAPALRRQGHGRSMMAAAEAHLQAAGCPKINLQIRSLNTAVAAFYRRLGYLPDEVVSLGKRLVNDARDERHAGN